MRAFSSTACAVIGIFFFAFAGLGSAAERVALVIGNERYEHTSRLSSPVRDLQTMTAALDGLGFDVAILSNASESEMGRAITEFSRKAREADTALLYYSGHGMEIAGRNYLVPVDAKLEREEDAAFESVELEAVIRAASGARRLSVVVLDACRDNRFPSAQKSGAKGFSPIRARRGQLIAFATAPGNIAYDGGGALSPFTQALAEALQDPAMNALDVRQLFGGLGPRVSELARGPQEPFTHSAGFGPTTVTLTGAPAAGRAAPSPTERRAYDAALKVGTVKAIQAFLSAFPGSSLRSDAEGLLSVLEASGEASKATEPLPNAEGSKRVASFGKWEKHCKGARCGIQQVYKDSQGRPVMVFVLEKLQAPEIRKDGERLLATGRIITPLNVLLLNKLGIRIDGGEIQHAGYVFCNVQGCVANEKIGTGFVKQLKTGENVEFLVAVPGSEGPQIVKIEMSLSGFTRAFDSL